MSKRRREPEEALGPQINGLETLAISAAEPEPDPEPELEEVAEKIIENPVVLICGWGGGAAACAALAADCGFELELAQKEPFQPPQDLPPARKIHTAPDYADLVSDIGIDDNYFICVFEENPDDRIDIISQCLDSEAPYLGVLAREDERPGIFAALRAEGAPDAELAAICCPMGLNVGARDEGQLAVGIVAELLAARAGTLGRLRHEP